MYFRGVNLSSVLVAAVSSMVIGFLWYSPLLFARPWMILMGYDPDDKSKLDEMRKGAGKELCHRVHCRPDFGACAGEAHRTQAPLSAPRKLDRFRGMAWFREHRAVDGRIVQQEAVQAVRDQHGISVGLLFGDGDDSGRLGIARR
jgi:hypothetical protein